MSFSEQTAHQLLSKPGPDDPLRLKDAVKIAFPFGGMTVSGLRREAVRGNLVLERYANKDFVTLNAISEMRKRCRASAKSARLWLEPEERNTEGKLVRQAAWVIQGRKEQNPHWLRSNRPRGR